MDCLECGKRISPLRALSFWPSRISCRFCKARHCVRSPHVVGVLLSVAAIASFVIPWSIASLIPPVISNGVYDRNPLQSFIFLIGPFLMVFMVVIAYERLLTRSSGIKLRVNKKMQPTADTPVE